MVKASTMSDIIPANNVHESQYTSRQRNAEPTLETNKLKIIERMTRMTEAIRSEEATKCLQKFLFKAIIETHLVSSDQAFYIYH